MNTQILHKSIVNLKIMTGPSLFGVSMLHGWQVLWIIPSESVRWLSILVAMCLSGSVLVLTFWPAVRDDHRRIALATVTVIVTLHVLLAVGCKVKILSLNVSAWSHLLLLGQRTP